MRVLMVTSSYPKFEGDVTAPFIESIARGAAGQGHEVDVVLPAHPQLDTRDGGPLRLLSYAYAPTDGLHVWGYAASLKADVRVRPAAALVAPLAAVALRRAVSRRLSERRYDVAHVHWVVPNAALVADIVRAHQVPLVVSLHGSDVFLAERFPPARPLARAALRSAGAVTACSADLHARALRLGAPPGRTRVVPYGVDVDGFSPRISAGAFRERLGIPQAAALVLGLGRLVEKKGFTHLVAAAAQVPGLHAVIAGEGDLRGALERQAREAGAPVVFAGNLDRQAVAAALAAADIVAVPSVVDRAGNVDGLPNALLEAMAAGRAVVASRIAGMPDVVEHEKNGLLVPPKDAPALAAALARLAGEPETRQRLGQAARRTAVERLSWEAASRRFEECYAAAAALHPR